MNRRGFSQAIAGGAVGVLVGYYAGAKELLGIQAEERPPRDEQQTPTDPPQTDSPTTQEPESTTEQSTTTSPTEFESGLASSGFPRFQYNNQNHGVIPDTAGPTESVSPRWRFQTNGNNHTTPVVNNGVVYFGGGGGDQNTNNNVYAVAAEDGEERWRFNGDAAFQSSPAITETLLYITNKAGRLYALNKSDGTKQWSVSYGNGTSSDSPIVTKDRVFVGDPDGGGLYGFDRDSGDQTWEFDTDTGVKSSPALDNGTLYFGTSGGVVYAVALADENQQWKFTTDGEIRAAPVVKDQTVYIATSNGRVHAVDATNGDQLWMSQTDQPINASPAVGDSSLYVGDGKLFETPGKLYSMRLDSGDIEWTFDNEGSYGGRKGAVINSPTVASGTIYYGVDGNKVYAVNAADGTEEWTYENIGVVLSSPAVHNGTVYIADDADNVYALE